MFDIAPTFLFLDYNGNSVVFLYDIIDVSFQHFIYIWT